MGNLTRDPELRVTSGGLNICKFAIATSRKFKGSDGTMKEDTAFIDIDAFGRQAEVISQYFTKGKPIMVEGRLKFDQWETPAGEKRSKLGVALESFQFVGGKGEGAEFATSSSSSASSSRSQGSGAVDFDDDVPF